MYDDNRSVCLTKPLAKSFCYVNAIDIVIDNSKPTTAFLLGLVRINYLQWTAVGFLVSVDASVHVCEFLWELP